MNMAFGLDVKNYNFSVQWSNTNLKGVREKWVLHGKVACTSQMVQVYQNTITTVLY
jgi:hypothetical protein